MRSALWLTLSLLATRAAAAQCVEDVLFAPASNTNASFGGRLAFDGTRVGVRLTDVSGRLSYEAFARTAGGFVHEASLVPSDEQRLLSSFDLRGRIAIVGADGHDHGNSLGAAWIFERDAAGSWNEVVELSPPGFTRFGSAVALGDGLAFVGARWASAGGFLSGAVGVFERSPAGWSEAGELRPAHVVDDAQFGSTLALHGTTLLVGAPRADLNGQDSGAAHVFEHDSGAWSEVARLVAPDAGAGDFFGLSLALGDGVAAIPSAGAIYVYRREPFGWTFEARLSVPDLGLAGSVAIDADRIWVGVPGHERVGAPDGVLRQFVRSGSQWRPAGALVPDSGSSLEGFGASLAFASGRLVVSSNDTSPAVGVGSVSVLLPTLDFALPYCSCDSAASCANPDGVAGCANSRGLGARLVACGTASVAADDLLLDARDLPPAAPGVLFMGAAPAQAPFGDGQRCVATGGVGVFRYPPFAADVAGAFRSGPGLVSLAAARFPAAGQLTPGSTWFFQALYRDPTGPCGSGVNLTNGLELQFAP